MGSDRQEPAGQTDHASIPPGTAFGRYELLRLIGAGGMGSVYEARHVDLDKRVALKVLARKLAKNRVYLERFLREGRIAARLDHPHVVSVSDVGTHDGTPFLVMELLSGHDLDTLLERRARLEVAEAIDLLLPILSALDAAHRAGLVHRDLKPANIFLARAAHGGHHPKLLDFGIAKPNQDDAHNLTATSDVFGTPQYMAPEQVRRSRDATSRSDQYAIAAVLYRCVVGREAFVLGESSVFELLERVVAGEFPPPRALRPEIPELCERVIVRAMAKRVEDRYVSVRELGAALLPFASPAARALWEPTFASADALAETLHPERLSGAGEADDKRTVVAARSGPAEAEAEERAKSERALRAPETLVAASSDTGGVRPEPRDARRSSRAPLFAGVAIGVVASALAAFGVIGRDAPARPAPSSVAGAGAGALATASATAAVATADGPAVTPSSSAEPASALGATVSASGSASGDASSTALPPARASSGAPASARPPLVASHRPSVSAPATGSATATATAPPSPSSTSYPIH